MHHHVHYLMDGYDYHILIVHMCIQIKRTVPKVRHSNGYLVQSNISCTIGFHWFKPCLSCIPFFLEKLKLLAIYWKRD